MFRAISSIATALLITCGLQIHSNSYASTVPVTIPELTYEGAAQQAGVVAIENDFFLATDIHENVGKGDGLPLIAVYKISSDGIVDRRIELMSKSEVVTFYAREGNLYLLTFREVYRFDTNLNIIDSITLPKSVTEYFYDDSGKYDISSNLRYIYFQNDYGFSVLDAQSKCEVHRYEYRNFLRLADDDQMAVTSYGLFDLQNKKFLRFDDKYRYDFIKSNRYCFIHDADNKNLLDKPVGLCDLRTGEIVLNDFSYWEIYTGGRYESHYKRFAINGDLLYFPTIDGRLSIYDIAKDTVSSYKLMWVDFSSCVPLAANNDGDLLYYSVGEKMSIVSMGILKRNSYKTE